jgi:hypothetical protein
MATQHAVHAVTDTPVLVSPDGVHSGFDLTIQNNSATANIFVGGLGVSPTNYGFKLKPDAAVSFELPSRYDIYVVSDGTATVSVLRIGLED